jgi:hypothetical protein
VSPTSSTTNSKFKIGKLKTTRMHVMETNKIAMVKKRKEERNGKKG